MKKRGSHMVLKIKDIELYYEQYGMGRPLILLHGNGEDHTIFQEAIAILAHHFTIYALDSRGHGNSSKVKTLHYEDMADDVYQFIDTLQLEKPILYGFSDGGIIALLVALHHQEILSRIIVSGVNVNPKGLKAKWRYLFRLCYWITRSAQLKLMLEEPHIPYQTLENITIPVDILAGKKDMIASTHLVGIRNHLSKGNLTIFPKETHGSYVIHSEKIAHFILEKVKENNEE